MPRTRLHPLEIEAAEERLFEAIDGLLDETPSFEALYRLRQARDAYDAVSSAALERMRAGDGIHAGHGKFLCEVGHGHVCGADGGEE